MAQSQQTPLESQETQSEEVVVSNFSEPVGENEAPFSNNSFSAPPLNKVTPAKGLSPLIKVMGLLLALIFAGVCFYFFYWIRTPEYSLNIIRNSVQKNDVVTFEKHVDLNSLLSSSFDSLIEAQLEQNGSLNPKIPKELIIFKPLIVSGLEKYILKEIGTPKEKNKTDNPSTPTNKNAKIAEDFSEKAGLKSVAFKGFGSTKTDGNLSLVELKLTDRESKKDFTLILKMAKLDDGSWKLIGIDNLKQYLIDYTKAKQKK